MTSEASSTTNSSRKRNLVDSEVDEVFVLQKNPEVSFTKTVSFSIADLLEKINDRTTKEKKSLPPASNWETWISIFISTLKKMKMKMKDILGFSCRTQTKMIRSFP